MTPLTEADYTIVVERRGPSKAKLFCRHLDENCSFAEKCACALFVFLLLTLVIIHRFVY